MRAGRAWTVAVVLLVVTVILAIGFSRLRLDADVFTLLPAESAMVDGLKRYQQAFGSTRELIITLRSPEAETSERLARSLAEEIQASGLASQVIWRSPLREDPAELAELVSYLWFNQSPEAFARLSERFREGALRPGLEHTLERMATSLRPQEVARLGQDPFALTDLTDAAPVSLQDGEEKLFASSGGLLRVLFVPAPFEDPGFWQYRRWVSQVKQWLAQWQDSAQPRGGLTVRVTGNPAFIAEFGSSLLRDVQLAALGTLFLVAGLFWLTHRRWAPLLWLVTLLALVLAVTIALGGILLGTLHAVSLGFAAILMGLAADYGLILYQDYIAHPERPLSEHRSAVAPGILWAAVTTAGAFLMVGRSSLPGLTQLGALVAMGILVAAVIMLSLYLPPLITWDKRRQDKGRRPARQPRPPGRLASLASNRTGVWSVTLAAMAGALALLAYRQPAVEYGTDGLGPKQGQARVALEEIQSEISGFDDSLWVIILGKDEGQVADRIERVTPLLEGAVRDGVLAAYMLPEALWPNPEIQAANREPASRLANRLPAAREAALDAGFAASSLRLTEAVFGAWDRFAASDAVARPELPGTRWLFRKFTADDGEDLLVLGRLEPSPAASEAELVELAAELSAVGQVQLIGWSLLAESLIGVMERDVRQVLVPMGVVLVVLLGLAFRRVGETVLSLATLGFSLLCLLGGMVLLGWSWNLMNVMALPLVFGSGVDYSIHIQHALRRYNGDIARVRQTIGPAILLCGASTAAAFGSLGLASNAGLASLGRVSAVGVIIASLTSVFLLPVWWQTVQATKSHQPALESG